MTAESETTAQGYVPAANHRSQVEAMAGYGVPECDIAKVLDIDPETLRLHYRRELEASCVRINAKVAENLYRKATGDGREAVTAAIFWLKTRARWKDPTTIEAAGEGGQRRGGVVWHTQGSGKARRELGERARSGRALLR